MAEDIYCSMAYERVTLADMPPDGRKKNSGPEGLKRNLGLTHVLRSIRPGEGVWFDARREPNVARFSVNLLVLVSSRGIKGKFVTRVDKDRERVGIWRLE